MWRATLRGLVDQPLRLALTALAIVLGVSFVAGSFVLTDSLGGIFTEVVEEVNAEVDVSVRTVAGPQRAPVPAAFLPVVRDVDGVRAADGFVGGFVQLVKPDGTLVEPDAGTTLGMSWPRTEEVTPFRARDGRAPQRDGELALDVATARREGIAVGDQVRVVAQGPAEPFTVVGLAGFGRGLYPGGSTLVAFDLPTAQRVFRANGYFDSILVNGRDDIPANELRDRVRDRLPKDGLDVVTRATLLEEGAENIESGLRFFRIAFFVFSAVSVLVAAFIIVNTFSIVVLQRTRQLALLQALGATSGQVLRSVLGEAAVIGFVASAIGGSGVSSIVLPSFAA